MILPIHVSLIKIARASYTMLLNQQLAFQAGGENLYYDPDRDLSCIIGACLTEDEADFLDAYQLKPGDTYNVNNGIAQLVRQGIVAVPFNELKTIVYLQDLHDSCLGRSSDILFTTNKIKKILRNILYGEDTDGVIAQPSIANYPLFKIDPQTNQVQVI